MAMNHEDAAADVYQEFRERDPEKQQHDGAGAFITGGSVDEKMSKERRRSSAVAAETGAETPEGDEPNEYEKTKLRRVGENLPASAFLIAFVELCERFAYYGAQGLFQNYINNKADGSDGPKGLGLGHQGATGLNIFFQFFCYVTPILGAIIADQYLGKYKTILIFAGVYWVGLLILWTTSLPPSIQGGSALGGYVAAIIVIGFGTGGIKSNIAPLIADQYQRRKMAIKIQQSGERTIIDPAITYQRIYMIFYWCINLGALSLLATPFMEKYKGFWTAFLMCFCMFNVGIAVLILRRKSYVVRPPQGSVITDAFKAIGMMISGRSYQAAKPSWRTEHGKTSVNWNDHFVDEIIRALRACKVFIAYPIFWVCYGQFSSNFVSQAAQMRGHGMPNDLMQNFDPISILVFIPVLDRIVYPIMRRGGYELRPMMRITIGFFLASLSLAYAAVVQHLIYTSGPCYDEPLNVYGGCPAGVDANGVVIPNNVHIVAQTPAYIFIGVAEIFISVTGLEYAYTKAPASMKSFVQSLYLFTNAFGSALNEALVPVLVDPKIEWMYTGVACFAAATSVTFWLIFHHYDADEEKMYALDRHLPELTHQGYKSEPREVDEDKPNA
ncbi:peptide transporter ptr2 [Vermiconidia calcicola]|uniref:Peptide transporter ptr2 n=1 Tax=Vermiconidia calcicola TaxID=1690605 RepID=A0ACC3NGE8_9PEZI|nr:peptide transporter ptr2 [Vermiconidia calcicola]